MTPPTETTKVIETALLNIPQVRRDELFIYFGQIGYHDIAQIKEIFLNAQAVNIEDEYLKAFVMAGAGKLYLLEGNYLYAKKLLDQALNLAQRQNRLSKNPTYDEVFAYVLYEKGLLFRHLIEPDAAFNCFSTLIDFTESDALRLFAKYQMETYSVEDTLDVNSLLPYLELTEPYSVQYILVLNRVGVILAKNGDHSNAKKYISKGIKLSQDNGLKDLADILNISLGYVSFLQKKYDTALETLHDPIKLISSNYAKVITLENIALVYHGLKNFLETIKNAKKANDISKQHSVISQIPGQHMYMGEVYEEKLHQLKEAQKQYRLGYEAATEQVAWGLSFTGERRKAVDVYVGFLQRHTGETFSLLPPKHPFEFTIGKSWKEIKDLFYQQLFQYHLAHFDSAEHMCQKLKIKPTTYYSLRARLAKEGKPLPLRRGRKEAVTDPELAGLRDWIQERRNLTRREIEAAFDREALSFLYERHGHRKNVLSRVLDLSYPTVVNKTKFLYQKGSDNF